MNSRSDELKAMSSVSVGRVPAVSVLRGTVFAAICKPSLGLKAVCGLGLMSRDVCCRLG